MLKKGKNKWTANLGLKAIALVSAFLIWLVVTNSNNPTRTAIYTNVPITIVNQDSIADIGKVVEPKGSGTVTVKVRESRYVIDRLAKNGSDFYVEADMENINQTNSVPLTVSCTNSSVTWDEIEISPASLKVTLENKLEQPFVVSVSTSGTPVSGYEVGTTEVLQGKNIIVAGPESLIKIINQVVAPISVNGMKSQMKTSSALKVIDKNGAELTENQMNSLEFKDSNGVLLNDRKVDVQVDLWRVQTDIPIVVETTGEPKSGYSVVGIKTIPVTISLTGTDEALASLEGKFKLPEKISVEGASNNITQEIDLTSMMADLENLRLITDANPNVSVEVQIEKTGDTVLTIPLSSIQLIDRPKDRNLIFTPGDKVSLSVHATDSSKKPITEADVKASINLDVCSEPGNYEIPLEVKLPEGYELSSDVTLVVNSEKQSVSETETE